MTRRTIDFLSSFGIMLLGLILLFFGSVAFTHQPVEQFVAQLPVATTRVLQAVSREQAEAHFPVSHPVLPYNASGTVFSEPLTAASVLVVDDRTNAVLYKHNADQVRSLASITKLMTALVLSDLPVNWATTTTVLPNDIDQDHHVSAGETYTLDQLWHIALVGSSNSAIHALVRSSGLTQDQFVARMNAKAKELDLQSLRFVEPTGLDSRDMGTALDVVRLLNAALQNKKIAQALTTRQYEAKPLNKPAHTVWSTDELLTNWIPNDFTIVGKTGYIDESGYNFTARITEASGQTVRVAVLGAATDAARFGEAKTIAEWVFDNFIWPASERFSTTAATTTRS